VAASLSAMIGYHYEPLLTFNPKPIVCLVSHILLSSYNKYLYITFSTLHPNYVHWLAPSHFHFPFSQNSNSTCIIIHPKWPYSVPHKIMIYLYSSHPQIHDLTLLEEHIHINLKWFNTNSIYLSNFFFFG